MGIMGLMGIMGKLSKPPCPSCPPCTSYPSGPPCPSRPPHLPFCHIFLEWNGFCALGAENKIIKKGENHDIRQIHHQSTRGRARSSEHGRAQWPTSHRARAPAQRHIGKRQRHLQLHFPKTGSQRRTSGKGDRQRNRTPHPRARRRALFQQHHQHRAATHPRHLTENGRRVRVDRAHAHRTAHRTVYRQPHPARCRRRRERPARRHQRTASGQQREVAVSRGQLPEPVEIRQEPGGGRPCRKTRPRDWPRR